MYFKISIAAASYLILTAAAWAQTNIAPQPTTIPPPTTAPAVPTMQPQLTPAPQPLNQQATTSPGTTEVQPGTTLSQTPQATAPTLAPQAPAPSPIPPPATAPTLAPATQVIAPTLGAPSTQPLPANQPALAPTPAPATTTPGIGQPKTDLLILLDASGSMNVTLDNKKMIDWAKEAVQGAVAGLPPDAAVGLRVYAHRIEKSNREESCKDTELMVPITKGSSQFVATAAQTLKPKGWTPIAYSLEQAAGDFSGDTETLHTIILVSDGEETCGGDPVAVVRGLIARGFKIKLFTIGFNVDQIARQQLKGLAETFGGTFTDVRGGSNLQQALGKLTAQTFLIQKADVDNRIRGGDSFQTAVSIVPNKRYRLDHHQRKGQFDFFSLNINEGQRVALHVYPVEKCITIVGNQSQERTGSSTCPPEAFSISLTNAHQKGLLSVGTSVAFMDSNSRTEEIPEGGGGIHYLIVGSSVGDMHRDNEFMVEVTGTGFGGDANTPQDAGGTFATATPIIPGLYESNRLSPLDKMDMFKINIDAPSFLKVVFSLTKSNDSRSHLEVLDELGAVLAKSPLLRATGDSSTYESSGPLPAKPIFLRITADDISSHTPVIQYSLGVSVTSVPLGIAPQPTAVPVAPLPQEKGEDTLLQQAPPPPAVAVIPTPVPQEDGEKAVKKPDVPRISEKPSADAKPFAIWIFAGGLVILLLIFGFTFFLIKRRKR